MRNTPQDFSREYTKSAYLECPWCGMRAMELVIAWEKDDDRTVNCAVVGSAYVEHPDHDTSPGPHVCLVDGFDHRRVFGEDAPPEASKSVHVMWGTRGSASS